MPDNLTEIDNASSLDMRESFEKSSKQTPRDLTFEQIFNNRNSIITSQMLERGSTREPNGNSIPPPPPVGFGFFYKEQFKNHFTTGTLLQCEIVCPDSVGGNNVSDYLYLTATNRAAKGVEALVSYGGKNKTCFLIYDWSFLRSQPDESFFKLTILFTEAEFRHFLLNKSVEGQQYQVLSLQNATTQSDTDPNYWYNTVKVYNHNTNEWALIYSQGYTATLAEQKNKLYGYWGPIIEVPFSNQNSFHGTNAMGFFNTQLWDRDDKNQWSKPTLLSPSNSDRLPEEYGFHPLFVQPNYNWVVTS